ncbi:MAG: polyamine aminopropyltransferase [Alphaproteobacteria bacterium]|nr:polyamine aminopropyltransferase [Alphaproteobacteria bacterium]
MTEWFTETLHPWLAQRLRLDRVLYREKTEHQDLIIFENEKFGRVLTLDGVVQTTEGDEFVYHEMLTHVPLTAHGDAKRVLIIGGGDGGMAREVLKHPEVEHLTMVEIDRSVVDMSAEHLPSLSAGAFDDARFNLVITDGAAYVAETDDRFDVIIVDSTDPIGPGEVLFTAEFYADCKRCLTEGGIVVTQNGVPFVQGTEVTNSWHRLGKSFADVWFFVAPVPTYQGGFMAFGWATDDKAKRSTDLSVLEERFERAGIRTRYYTPAVHQGSFALPRFILDLLK